MSRDQCRMEKPKEWAPVDVASRLNFNILSMTGSFSGAYLDALAGTWVRNLQGLKLCMIIPEGEMMYECDSFFRLGDSWLPDGKERLVFLEEDDVLLMPPGLRVVYATHSLTACLTEGGVFWDDHNVVKTLYTFHWKSEHHSTATEAIGFQLPWIVAQLEVMVQDQIDRFRGHSGPNDFSKAVFKFCGDFKRAYVAIVRAVIKQIIKYT